MPTLLAFLGQNAFSPLEMGVLDHRRGLGGDHRLGSAFLFRLAARFAGESTPMWGKALAMLTLTGEAWSSEGDFHQGGTVPGPGLALGGTVF